MSNEFNLKGSVRKLSSLFLSRELLISGKLITETVPYRRLPTTDAARIRALEAANAMADRVNMTELAFASRNIHPLRNAISRLQGAKHQQKTAYEHMIRTGESNHSRMLKTKIYLSHFIQVLNLAIQRDEIPVKARTFYGLDETDGRVPDLSNDEAIFEWGRKIIDGESKRVTAGGIPMMNPTSAKVKVWYDQFKDGYYNLQTAVKSNERANQKMIEVRQEIDRLIAEVWNEVEARFASLGDEEKRRRAAEYGVVYVTRPGNSLRS